MSPEDYERIVRGLDHRSMPGTYNAMNDAVTATIDEHKSVVLTVDCVKRELSARWLVGKGEPLSRLARFWFWFRFALRQLTFTKRWAG